jgi:IS5 family transposase
MYTSNANQILQPHEFFLPFGGQLDPKNRWCRIALMMPWAELEQQYVKKLHGLGRGRNAYSVRMALGAVLIAQMCGYSDEQLVQQIQENPYMQYLLGLSGFQQTPAFDASLMVYFRRRLSGEPLEKANEIIAIAEVKRRLEEKVEKERKRQERAQRQRKKDPPDGEGGTGRKTEQVTFDNCGELILDATCVPVDIHYPTDLRLLHEAREWTERCIDAMHRPDIGVKEKPRTYREEARREYLHISKNKKAKCKQLRKGIRKQLQYLRRDLGIIAAYEAQGRFTLLSALELERLETCRMVYAQQKELYETGKSPQGRIVSLHMPFVRPIKRGKAGAETEFGPKVSISVVEGMVFAERISFENFNEGITLIESAERYKQRFGFYPKAILADQIYRNRENLDFCKAHHIRLSGKPLGRPRLSAVWRSLQRQLERLDAGARNAVEGKFGEGKRCAGLDRIGTRLEETCRAVIVAGFMSLNLKSILRILFCAIWNWVYRHYPSRFLPPDFSFSSISA